MQRVAMMISKEMASRFENVTVFDMDCFYVPKKYDKGINSISKWKKNYGKKYEAEIRKMFDHRVKIEFMPDVPYRKRNQAFCRVSFPENDGNAYDFHTRSGRASP